MIIETKIKLKIFFQLSVSSALTARKLADKVLARIRQRNLLSINEIEHELSPLVGAGENAGNAIEKDFKAKVGTLVTDQARSDLIGDYGSEALNIAADIVAEEKSRRRTLWFIINSCGANHLCHSK